MNINDLVSAYIGSNSNTGSQEVTVGYRFQATEIGRITHLWGYVATDMRAGTRTLALWTATGTLLGQISFSCDPASPGWKEIALPAPIIIQANTEYRVSQYIPEGTGGSFRVGATSPAPGSSVVELTPRGCYTYNPGLAFPNDGTVASWYTLDVTFLPGTGQTGTTYNESRSEIVTASDSLITSKTVTETVLEVTNSFATQAATRVTAHTLPEQITATDTLELTRILAGKSITELVTVDDTYFVNRIRSVFLTESILATDSVESALPATAISEILGLTESVTAVLETKGSCTETIIIWDRFLAEFHSTGSTDTPVPSDTIERAMLVASRMIAKYGAPMDLVVFTDSLPVDPEKPWRVEGTTALIQTVRGVIVRTGRTKYGLATDDQEDLNGQRTGERRILVAALGLTNDPNLKGEIRIGTIRWKISSIEIVGPDRNAILYILQVRQ